MRDMAPLYVLSISPSIVEGGGARSLSVFITDVMNEVSFRERVFVQRMSPGWTDALVRSFFPVWTLQSPRQCRALPGVSDLVS